MDTTDNNEAPKRRIEDQAQAAKLDWTKPDAPAVPAAPPAPGRIPLRAVASMCVKPDDISFFPTTAGKMLEPGHYMLSVQGAAIACTDAGKAPAAGTANQAQPVATFDGYDGENLKPVFTLIGTLNAGDKLCVCAPAQAAAPSGLQPLKALALAATPGPWRQCLGTGATELRGEAVRDIPNPRTARVLRSDPNAEQNAAFIAAANPAVVLDLIARIEHERAAGFRDGLAKRLIAEVVEEEQADREFARLRAQLARQQAAPAAIPEGWKLVPIEPTPEIMAAAGEAVWSVASPADFDMARKAAGLILMRMDAAKGVTVDMLAATIATMAPAYRAMLAAAPAHPAMPALEDRTKLRDEALSAARSFADCEHEHARNLGKGGPGIESKVRKAEDRVTKAICALAAPAMQSLLDKPQAEPTVPEGFVLMPKRLTRAMRQALGESDWEWPDFLAAAEVITEDEYNELIGNDTLATAGEVSQGAAPTATALRDATLNAQADAILGFAQAVRDADITGHGTVMRMAESTAAAIRALKRAAQPNIQEAGNA